MPIAVPRESSKARVLAETVLASRLAIDVEREGLAPTAIADGRGRLGMLPVYSVARGSLAAGELRHAWRAGWRYIWLHPALEHGASLSIRPSGNRGPRVIRYRWSRTVPRLGMLLDALEAELAQEPESCRVRLLRIAPAAMEAVWIHRRTYDTLYGLTPRLDDGEFVSEALARLAALEQTGPKLNRSATTLP